MHFLMIKTILKLFFFIVFIENICNRKLLHVYNSVGNNGVRINGITNGVTFFQ